MDFKNKFGILHIPKNLHKVQVCCRFRPLTSKEKKICEQKENPFELQDTSSLHIYVPHRIDMQKEKKEGIKKILQKGKKETFHYDHIFHPESTQEDVFDYIGKPMIKELMEGYNCTIFAYGQSGSGKTFSIFGHDTETGQTGIWKNEQGMGIIPRSIKSIFNHIQNCKDNIEFTIKVSFLEIYLEKIKDLLNPKQQSLKIRETKDHDIYVEHLKEHYAGSFEDIIALIHKGQKCRAVAETKLNQYSSRSHSILMIQITQTNLDKHTRKKSKLFLIDLAGSERVDKSGAEGLSFIQVKHINKSLLILGNVIHAITEKEPHIPYRDSKLTRLLQDSLGGNSKTCLLITCSPSWYNLSETYSTLQFGSRAKKIENNPRVNQELTIEDYQKIMMDSNQMIKEQKETITLLEKEINELISKSNKTHENEYKINHKIIYELKEQISNLEALLSKSKDNELQLQNQLQDQIQQNKEDIELKLEEIETLKQTIKTLQIEKEKKDKQINILKDQCNTCSFEKKKCEIELFSNHASLVQLKEEKEYIEQTFQIEIEKLQEQIKKLHTEIKEKETYHLIHSDCSKELQIKYEEKIKELCLQIEQHKIKDINQEQDIKKTYEKKYNTMKYNYDIMKKQYEILQNEVKNKMEENLALQVEKDQIEMKLKEKQIDENKYNHEIIKETNQKDKILKLQTDLEDLKYKYEISLEEKKYLKKQINHLLRKHNKLSKIKNSSEHKNNLSETSKHESSQQQFNEIRKNLHKMKEYNKYIRGREQYYVQMIENRRQHIETLEITLNNTNQIMLLKEQEHQEIIANLRNEINRLYRILKEMGIPEHLLTIKKQSNVIVPIVRH